jgi:hypothetical protein
MFRGIAALSPSGDNNLISVGALLYSYSADIYCKAVVYKQSDLSLVAVSSPAIIPSSYATRDWVQFFFPSSVPLEAETEYIIGIVNSTVTSNVFFVVTATGAPANNMYVKSSLTYNSPQDPLSSPTFETYLVSIYGYYEVNSPGPTPSPGKAFGQNAQSLFQDGFI